MADASPDVGQLLGELLRSQGKLEGKLETLTELVRSFHQSVADLDGRVSAVERIQDQRSGFIDRFIKVEDTVKTLERKFWIVAGGASVLSFIATQIIRSLNYTFTLQ